MDEKAILKRLANTEKALVSLWSLLEDVTPPAYSETITKMISDYLEANEKLGGFKKSGEFFE